MLTYVEWIWNNYFCNDGIVIFLLVFIGYRLSKRSVSEAIAGGIRGYVGLIVYWIATGGIGSAFRPLIEGFTTKYAASLAINDSYYGLAMMEERVRDLGGNMSLTSMAMVVGILISIVLALGKKITKVRIIMTMGSSYAYEALRYVPLVFCLYPSAPAWLIIVLAGATMACHAACMTNLSVEAAQDFSDGANMSIDHVQNLGDYLAWKIGKKIEKDSIAKTGKKPKSLDDIKLPGWLSIFDDVYVASFITMFIFFGILILSLGRDTIMQIDPDFGADSSFLVYIFETAGKFPMYLVVLFVGLKMFSAEIMVAFEGLNKKVLKGVLPAVDIAAFFGFVENGTVITLGFIIGTIEMMLWTAIGLALKSPFAVMMGFTQMMFDNAPVAMFGHKHGGIKGLVIGASLSAFVDTVLGGLAIWFMGYMPYSGATFQFDYAVEYSIFGKILPLGIGFYVLFLLILLAVPQIQYALTKDKEDYWLVSEDYEAYKQKHAND